MATKPELAEDLSALGIEVDPADHSHAELTQMLRFAQDDDETEDDIPDDQVHDPMAGLTDTVTPMETGIGGDEDDEDDDDAELAALLGEMADDDEHEPGGDPYAELDDDTADRIAALFDEVFDEEDDTDLGLGVDLDGPHIEVADTYHVDSLIQGRKGVSPESMDMASRLQLVTELTEEEMQRIIKPTLKKAIMTAREQGRAVTGFPVVAHIWAAKGNGRYEVIVQVPVKPLRRTAANRRAERRARRS